MTAPNNEDVSRLLRGFVVRRSIAGLVIVLTVGLGALHATAQMADPLNSTTSSPSTTTTRAPVAGRSAGEADGPGVPTDSTTPDPDTVKLAPLEGYTGGGIVEGDNPLRDEANGLSSTRRPLVLQPQWEVDKALETARLAAAAAADRQNEATLAAGASNNARTELAQVDVALARSLIDRQEAERAVAEARTELTGTAVALFTQGRGLPDLLNELVDNAAVTKRAANAVATDSALEHQIGHLRERNTALSDALALVTKLTARQPEAAAEFGLADDSARAADHLAQQATTVATIANGAAAIMATQVQPLLSVVKGFGALAEAQATFPIAGRWEFEDTWGFPRSGGRRHKGNDLFCASGTPLVAIESGIARPDGDTLGGLVVYLEGESGALYYYAHLLGVDKVVVARSGGVAVKAGDVIGYCGNSGNAFDTPAHLHIQIAPPGGEWVNPYPLLRTLAEGVMLARSADTKQEGKQPRDKTPAG